MKLLDPDDDSMGHGEQNRQKEFLVQDKGESGQDKGGSDSVEQKDSLAMGQAEAQKFVVYVVGIAAENRMPAERPAQDSESHIENRESESQYGYGDSRDQGDFLSASHGERA